MKPTTYKQPSQNKERAGHKPGSVLSAHNAKRAIIYLGRLLPNASSGSICGTGKRPTLAPLPCSQPGFTEPTPLNVAGALLPHLCTLTSCLGKIAMQFHPSNFGGMFLWHYPHGRPHWALPSKSGLWGARTFLSIPVCWNTATASPALSQFQCKSKTIIYMQTKRARSPTKAKSLSLLYKL